jgi:hypothetical protein
VSLDRERRREIWREEMEALIAELEASQEPFGEEVPPSILRRFATPLEFLGGVLVGLFVALTVMSLIAFKL